MYADISKKRVIVKIQQPESKVLLLKRPKFVKATVLQAGSEIKKLKPGDTVMCYNEGVELAPDVRLVFEPAIVLKFN